MFRDKLKKLINKNDDEQEGNDKKKIENLVFFVILLIVTIVIINAIWNGKNQVTKQENNTTSKQLASTVQNDTVKSTTQTTDNLEEKLENILSNIQGVGEVKVCINYSESSEVVAMYNETSKISNTEESDTSGGTRKIQETDSQKEIVYQEDDGEKTPITQKIVQPKIEGAIITAKGANNIDTKTNIIQAVEAITGLATHKIQVFEMN
jgi:stage III sporulation protein AG